MSPEIMSEDSTELSDHAEVRPAPLVYPDDPHNRALVASVRPAAWKNPSPKRRYNLVVIGAGAAGLTAATHAATLGARVALVERFLLGGELFANGTIPSKALLAVARRAADARRSANFGLDSDIVAAVDFGAAMERVRRLRTSMSLRASAERYTDLGVDIYFGEPRFSGSTSLQLGSDRLKFNYALITTGTSSTRLDLPGAAEVETYTSETIFSLTEIPRHLIVVGGGPVGCELAQAFRRLGAQVTIVSRDARLLPHEDVEAASVLKAQLESEGVALALGATLTRLENRGGEKAVAYDVEGVGMEAVGDAILVAIGRTPNLDTLKLEAAGVAHDEHGVKVNERLQTTCRRIFAAGDVCSTERYAHAAEAQARLAVNNALLYGLRRATRLIIPHAIYTEPEIAHVGLYETQAQAKNLAYETLRVPLGEIDRAVLDGHGRGFAQVLYLPGRRGRILGATVVGRHAGEIIGEISLAMTAELGLRHLSRTVHPYPTESEILKRLGDAFTRGRRHPKLKEYLSGWFWLERLLP